MSEPTHSTIPPTPPSTTDAAAEHALNRRQVRGVAWMLVLLAIIDLLIGSIMLVTKWWASEAVDITQKLLFGLLFIVLAIGQFSTWRWARVGTIITLVVRFTVLMGLTVAALEEVLRHPSLSGFLIDLLLPLIICLTVYAAIIHALTRPGVKALFEEK